MSEIALPLTASGETARSTPAARLRRRRRRAERRFRLYGLGAILIALSVLALLLMSVGLRGSGAFSRGVVELEIHFAPEHIDPEGRGTREAISSGDYEALTRTALRELFPEVSGRKQKRRLYALVSSGAGYALRDQVLADPSLIGSRQRVRLPLSDEADRFLKGHVTRDVPESDRKLRDDQLAWLETLSARGAVTSTFNVAFLTSGDSREPELAGIGGALVGSILTLLVTLAVAFPIGVAAAVYLEEFAPRNRWTDLIEININNLAAVPSILFGLLGLAFFLGFLGLPRSASLVGGLVLGIRTLPIIIIASRAAVAAVPPSIREAALALGASPVQTVAHHILPQAMPGILTGTIIGVAQALGETAPLLLVGMVAFVADVPTSLQSPATVLPVQIFLWADAPERAFVEKTAGAILVLLGLLVSLNATAVVLRQRFAKPT